MIKPVSRARHVGWAISCICSPKTREAESGGHLQPHSEFDVCQGYMKLISKRKKNTYQNRCWHTTTKTFSEPSFKTYPELMHMKSIHGLLHMHTAEMCPQAREWWLMYARLMFHPSVFKIKINLISQRGSSDRAQNTAFSRLLSIYLHGDLTRVPAWFSEKVTVQGFKELLFIVTSNLLQKFLALWLNIRI